jgi:hypothetical protein
VTSHERLISAFIAAHLAALVVVSIPSLHDFSVQSSRVDQTPPVPALARTLDAVADAVERTQRTALRLTFPLRRAATKYATLLGLQQRWDMFSNPMRKDWHARIVYRIRRADGSLMTEEERVFPSGAPGWKLVASYRASYLDKATTSGIELYQSRAADATTPTPWMAAAVEPLTRYYARRRAERGLPDGAAIVAVEFWWGVSDLPRPSSSAQPPNASIHWQLWTVDDLQ